MDDKEKIYNFIASVGSLAEMFSIFHKTLLDNGINGYDALVLTREFINVTVSAGFNKNE